MKDNKGALQAINRIRESWNDNWLFTDVLKEELGSWEGKAWYRLHHYIQAEKAFKSVLRLRDKLPEVKRRPLQVMSSYYVGKINYEKGQMEQARKWLEKAAATSLEESPYYEAAQRLLDRLK